MITTLLTLISRIIDTIMSILFSIAGSLLCLSGLCAKQPVIVPASAFPDKDLHEAAQFVVDGKADKAIVAANRSKAGMNTIGPEGDTLLLLAIRANNPKMVEALLAAGADPNTPPGTLAFAMDYGGIKIIKALLKANADPNSTIGGEPALWRAALSGRQESAELLVKAGADVNRADLSGDTPAIAAAQTDNYGMVIFLLQNGASPFADNNGHTIGSWTYYTYKQGRLSETTEAGKAMLSLINILKEAGSPWPPPGPQEVLEAKGKGMWPPKR